MAVQKLSQIAAAGVAPAVTDQAVFVTGGTTDNLVTVTQLAAGLPAFTAGAKGSVPASGGGTTTFLRADATFAVPPTFTSVAAGYVPASGGGTTNFLRADGSFAVPPTTASAPNLSLQFDNGGVLTGATGTSWDNTNLALTITGATITTNNPIINGSQTWNAGGVTFTGLRVSITNTASASGSKAFEVLAGAAGATSLLAVVATGATNFFGGQSMDNSGNVNAGAGFTMPASGSLAWTGNVALFSDAAGILADRNSTNAQTVRIYNTFTDSSNYERHTIDWKTTANVCYVRNENAGTGSARLMVPVTGSTTFASLPSAATAGAGARSFITDATTTTFAAGPVGGGTNKVPVYSDGTNWFIG